MISYAEVEKLLSIQAVDRPVLSAYLDVPVDPAALRGLPARLSDLFALGGGPAGPGAGRAQDVAALPDPPGGTAACLRFPLT